MHGGKRKIKILNDVQPVVNVINRLKTKYENQIISESLENSVNKEVSGSSNDGDDNIYDDNGNITQKKKKSVSKNQIISQSRSKSKRGK